MNLLDFPNDVILYLSRFLDIEDTARFSSVNKRLRELLSDDFIWFHHCWNIISPFWLFVELPAKQQEQSFKEYFSAISKIAIKLDEPYSGDNIDFNEIKVGDEIWTRIDDFNFKNNVWKLANWSADVSVGNRGDSQCDHFMNNIIRYKRSHVSQSSNDSNNYLSSQMRDDLMMISHVYGFPYSGFNHEISTKPKTILSSKAEFRGLFENIPLFCCKVQMQAHKYILFILSALIYEYFETVLRDLAFQNVIAFHQLKEILFNLVKFSVLKSFDKPEEVFCNYEDPDKFTMSLLVDEGEESDDDDSGSILDEKLPLDFNTVRKSLLNATLLFPNVIKDFDPSYLLPNFSESHQEFLSKKVNRFLTKARSMPEHSVFAFLRFYLAEKFLASAEKLMEPIENTLFLDNLDDGNESNTKKCKQSAGFRVFDYALTDSDMLGGENDHQSEAVRLFVNDQYGVIVFEHVFHC